jgi:peptide/nickel transport system substrate-binding protein
MHATDRQQMVEAFLQGQSEVAHSFISPRRREASELQGSIVRYDYDPGRATQMIEALGYAKGPDGIFVNPSGERLSLEVRGRVALEIQVKTLLTIADQWKAAGVAVEPVVVPNEVERDYRANYPTFEIVRQPNDLDVYSLLRYHGRQSPLPENRYAGTNRTRYRNPEYDALLDRFAITIEPNERMQVLGQVIHHMTDQLNIMGMFYDAEVVVINHRLQNISPNAKEMSSSTTWNAHEWGVRG